MRKTILIIGIGFVTLIIGLLYFSNDTKTKNVQNAINDKQIDSSIIKRIRDNDKLILVKDASKENVIQAIRQFCELYNKNGLSIKPRLFIFKEQFIITFPQNIDFEYFCYFINYLKFPHNIEYRPQIRAWCSTRGGDEWMTEEIVNKKVMIYIPEWDDENDNVYLTTLDNINFKMGFAIGQSHIKLDDVETKYESNPIDVLKLKSSEIIDF